MGIFRPMLLGSRFGHLQIIRRNLPVISKSNSFSVNTAVSKESKQEAQSFNHAHKQGNKRGRKGSFGIMFDIDGVFVRGRHIIPSARAAMKKVIDMDIPYIFLTNSGCETEEHKARVLTTQLHQKIEADQVVLSHSPLRNLNILHDKQVVVSGQGPIKEIASSCGFKNVTTVEEVSEICPQLDMNDRRKRHHMPPDRRCSILRVEGIILFGEPIQWETHIQVLVDLLITRGRPNQTLSSIPNENLPVIAVNTDLLWMGEASNPRFGNGAFLCCLESVYKKLTGNDLVYTSILGKPNLFTYKYGDDCLKKNAAKLFGHHCDLETIYVVGDNVDTDIYGANIYAKYLRSYKEERDYCREDGYCDVKLEESSASKIKSVLVQTGVSSVERSFPQKGINHLHRDTSFESSLTMPSHVVEDVLEAVELICHKEDLEQSSS